MSSALLLFVALVAPDVVCPDRRQHVLPLMFARPLTGVDYVIAKVGAIATILFAFSFLPQVVLFVGNMLVSDSALDYFTGHSTCCGRCRSRSRCSRCTTPSSASRSRRSPTGASSPARRSSACSSSRRSRRAIIVGDTSGFEGGSAGALINVLALPLYLRDLVFLGHIDRDSPLNGVHNGGLLRGR